jgi:hypothetical protein
MKALKPISTVIKLFIVTIASLNMKESTVACSNTGLDLHSNFKIFGKADEKTESSTVSWKDYLTDLWPFGHRSTNIIDNFGKFEAIEPKEMSLPDTGGNLLGAGIKDNYVVFKQRMYSGGQWEPREALMIST